MDLLDSCHVELLDELAERLDSEILGPYVSTTYSDRGFIVLFQTNRSTATVFEVCQ